VKSDQSPPAPPELSEQTKAAIERERQEVRCSWCKRRYPAYMMFVRGGLDLCSHCLDQGD
jgi:hypothetical protein